MKRIAIVVSKKLNKGETANVASILMGQTALQMPEIYDANPVPDTDGQLHAAIRFSSVLLEANGTESLLNFARRVKAEFPTLTSFLFTQTGQGLNNAFEQYKTEISTKSTESLSPVGIIVAGEDDLVRQATKKFSLLK
jgi:hypothetical protein